MNISYCYAENRDLHEFLMGLKLATEVLLFLLFTTLANFKLIQRITLHLLTPMLDQNPGS